MASGIFMRFRRAPLQVLGILLSSMFWVSLVYHVFVGRFAPFPPGSVSFLLSFGVGVRIMVGICTMSYYFLPLSF